MAQELYQLPKGWEWKAIGDVASTTSGGTPSRAKSEYWNGKIPWVKSGELGDGFVQQNEEFITEIGLANSSAKIFAKGSLLLALYGATAGKLGILTYDAATNQAVCQIQPNSILDRDYLRNYLLSIREMIVADSFGGAQPNISQGYVRGLQIPLPPLPEQKRIVAKLDALLSRIAQATQELQQSLALADQLFASALDEAFNPLGSVKNADGLYELPKGWESVLLGDVVTLLNGRAYKQEELLEQGPTPVLRVGNFFSNRSWYYSDLELEEDKYCNEGDLLFAWSASFGPKIWDGPRAIFHYHIWKIKLGNRIDKYFLYYLLEKDAELIKSQGNGVGMFHATKGGMEKKEIPLPPLPEQKRIVQRLEALQAKQKQLRETLNEKIAGLNALKASLLDSAFRGEL